MKKLTGFQWTAIILLLIGGLNWGLVGLFNFDLVAMLFGEGSVLSRAIYTLVGIGALYGIFMTPHIANESYCKMKNHSLSTSKV
jgi:uncharacterized membrane protein YuzA (DUF378 family)